VRTSGEVTIQIDADPMTVYGLVADVTRIGEFSPECHRARWQGGSSAAVSGARFRGRNASRWIRWSRECEVLTSDPGRGFSFRTIPTVLKRDSTVWNYRFGPSGDGTNVIESYEIVQLPPAPVVALIRRLLPHHLDMRPHMQRTLEALKHTAEAIVHDATPADAAPAATAREAAS
jgi:hypothetical protein